MKARWWIAIVTAALAVRGACTGDDDAPPLRVASFNIEDFPKTSRQIAGAFDEIARLDAPIVAVQEIVDHEVFAHAARERLGTDWDFIYADTSPRVGKHPVHHLGVLFDRRAFTFVSTALHDDTRLSEGRHKPTLELRLKPTGGGAIVRVLVVHLKAGGDNQAIRARQLIALADVVRGAQTSGDRIVLLGDFNSTDDNGDRRAIARLAADTGMAWASEGLGCSAFWNRDDGCPRSRLDHVLSSTPAKRVEAAGACATEGCDWQASCPLYRDEVSDHCPVIATF
jgi:endonuclease/exonuclease/phosphatase family metal-dependent hydrolase